MITDERKKEIEEFDEVKSYFFIDAIGAFTWRMSHDASHGRIDMTPELQKALEDMHEEQVYCAQQLTKFGVDHESVKNRPDGDYWKWYNHWHNWHQGMSDEQWNEVNSKMVKNEDISHLLPKNKWNEILTT